MTPERAAEFLDAQDRVWTAVRSELAQGRKTSHWIWFVFPQLASLGRSPTSRRFGIRDLREAADYLANDRLRARLEEAATLMLTHAGKSPESVLGPIDALKLRSSMTLFSRVPGASPLFRQVLDTFYDGTPCPLTLKALEES
ncbi:DUF1810 domain-containing protein [Jhaorihella thermophila]|uniref:Uncharacterized protein, DUF1810 family n=1 Tax=Jhaorihella thermophila TaxID=488547 RepID=A0A1H5VNS3_9RHOB|nr:DUF1810 domain-containing protein [Jhaorihella thermophila]SEF88985.1 Uncharacterized protein, DUF1810 family [Jhaorihella thermophila]